MKRTTLCLLLASLSLLAVGCDKKPGKQPKPGSTKPYVPPPKKFRKELLKMPADAIEWAAAPAEVKDFAGVTIETSKAGSGGALAYDQIGRFHINGMDAFGKSFQRSRDKSGDSKGEPLIMRLRKGLYPDAILRGAMGMKVGETRLLRTSRESLDGGQMPLFRFIPADTTKVIVEIELVSIENEMARRIAAGQGKSIEAGGRGIFHYTGVFAKNGKKFDTSRDPGKNPLTFQLAKGVPNAPIDGWVLGLPGMKVGEKRWLKLPPEIAYGERGRDGIGPNETLIFEVELVSITE